MKKTILLTIISILALSFAAAAQDGERYASSRLSEYATQLKRATVDLADRTSDRLSGYNSATRAEIEEAFLAAQLDGAAGLFQEMTRSNRRANELRDAASLMNDLGRRAPSYGSNGNLWRDAQNAIGNISRELGSGGGGGGENPPNNGPVIGRLYWRGTVDAKVQLVIRGDQIEHRTLGGRPYPDGIFSFTSGMPNRRVDVEVEKKRGRGDVRVIQQPARGNDFTAVIEINDDDGGAKEYQIEVFWR